LPSTVAVEIKKVVQGFYRFPCFALSKGRLNPLLEQSEEIGTKFDSLSVGFLSKLFKKIKNCSGTAWQDLRLSESCFVMGNCGVRSSHLWVRRSDIV